MFLHVLFVCTFVLCAILQFQSRVFHVSSLNSEVIPLKPKSFGNFRQAFASYFFLDMACYICCGLFLSLGKSPIAWNGLVAMTPARIISFHSFDSLLLRENWLVRSAKVGLCCVSAEAEVKELEPEELVRCLAGHRRCKWRSCARILWTANRIQWERLWGWCFLTGRLWLPVSQGKVGCGEWNPLLLQCFTDR